MKLYFTAPFFIAASLLTSCTPITPAVTNQYKLESFSKARLKTKPTPITILVTAPEAVAGYQTEQMIYVKKPFEISAFANNAWVNPPADMLLPIIVQSLQNSGYFKAVASSATAEKTDFQLDTDLIELQQNFLKKPSEIDVVIKADLSRTRDNKVLASRLFTQHIVCPMEKPYGGVLAANQAMLKISDELTRFVVKEVAINSHLIEESRQN